MSAITAKSPLLFHPDTERQHALQDSKEENKTYISGSCREGFRKIPSFMGHFVRSTKLKEAAPTNNDRTNSNSNTYVETKRVGNIGVLKRPYWNDEGTDSE